MNLKLSKLAVAALTVLFAGTVVETYACSCMTEQPVCEALGSSSVVFVGRAVGSAERKTYEDRGRRTTTTYDVGTIYFEVEEAFSGVKGKRRVEIHSGTGGADCGYWFLRGQRYLVYAGAAEDGTLWTNICTRTRPLKQADEDLKFLRQLPPAGTGARIYGMVGRPPDYQAKEEERKVEGLAGIKITITSARGERRELFTDPEGKYEISNLKPGEYSVNADLPDFYYKDEYATRKLRVADKGCAREDFAAIPNGTITGHVVTAEGEPVREAEIVLLKADAEGALGMRDEVGKDYMKDEQGKFEIGQVPPGEYVLGLNLTWAPKAESPYPPTYYPGATERSEAKVIKVGLGEKVSDLLLRLPPPLAERTVHGVVVWPDGTPAVGAEVYLMDINHPGYTTTGWGNKTDVQGRFKLKGYDGISYWVHANAPKYPNKPYKR